MSLKPNNHRIDSKQRKPAYLGSLTPYSSLLFGILHLSDFHLSDATEYETGTILGKLINDAKNRIDQLGIDPVYVLITGDLTYSGKTEQFKYVNEFLSASEKALSSCSLQRYPKKEYFLENRKAEFRLIKFITNGSKVTEWTL